MRKRKKKLKKLLNELFDEKNSKPVYKGYVDDPRNTDNSWMETAAIHFHCSPELAKALPLKAGDDAGEVQWLKVSESTPEYRNLFASHKDFADLAVKELSGAQSSKKSVTPQKRKDT